MSSDDEEFFDAPDAFSCSSAAHRWNLQKVDEEALYSDLDFEHKNARRRSKVESLKRNYVEQTRHPHIVGSLYSGSNAGFGRLSLRESDFLVSSPGLMDNQKSASAIQSSSEFTQFHSPFFTATCEPPKPLYMTPNQCLLQSTTTSTPASVDISLDPFLSRSPITSSFRTSLCDYSGVARVKTRTVPTTSQPESADQARMSATIATFFDQNDFPALNYYMPSLDQSDVFDTSADLRLPPVLLHEDSHKTIKTQSSIYKKTAVDSMVQTSDNLLTTEPRSLGRDPRDGTLVDQMRTLQTVERMQNPIELRFRTLTGENRPVNIDHEKSATESRVTLQASNQAPMKLTRFQKYLRGAVSAVKSVTKTKIFNPDEELSDEDEELIGSQGIRLRSSRQARGNREFVQIKLIQEMKNEHTGAIWAMRFSPCGRLLATAGYDRNIRIWVLRQWYSYFKRMQQSSVTPPGPDQFGGAVFNTGDYSNFMEEENMIDSLSLTSNSASTTGRTDDGASTCSSTQAYTTTQSETQPRPLPDLERGRHTVFRSQPLMVYRGHEGVVTDVAWSKNLFLLATSMDHQVRLWHISRRECLCSFNHNDTVPTIVFHPKDDRYFLSGSLDGKLRLWNIPDKKVRFWVEVPLPSALPESNCPGINPSAFAVSSFFKPSPPTSAPQVSSVSGGVARNCGPKTIITCATFACDGTKVVVGTYDGRVMFFNSELSYITFITIRSGTTRARHTRITAIELDPTDSNKILVTSNDSRLRLIDARDYHTLCKYRGFVNETSQIRASFSPTGRYLISGSENAFFYIWRKSLDIDRISRFSRLRKDRNNRWEAIKAHDTMVTVALFSPNPNLVLDKTLRHSPHSPTETSDLKPLTFHTLGLDGLPKSADPRYPMPYLGELIVSADCNGCIRVFRKRHTEPPQQSSAS